MKSFTKLLTAAAVSIPLLTTGCSPKEVSQITSQSEEITSQAVQQVRELGAKASEIAGKAVTDLKGYIDSVNGSDQSALDTVELKNKWANIKGKFNEMADSATSTEVKEEIRNAVAGLEEQFNALLKNLETNQDVAKAKEAVAKFWNAALTKLNEFIK